MAKRGRGPERVATAADRVVIVGEKRRRCAEWWRTRVRAGGRSSKVMTVADRVATGGARAWRRTMRRRCAGVLRAIASGRSGGERA